MINLNIIKNFINIFILILLSINTGANLASIRNNKNNIILNKKLGKDSLKLIDYRLISKDLTLEKLETFGKAYKARIDYLDRKIVIRNDYLKLIKIFPSKKNIKNDDLIKEIKILENRKDYLLNMYQNKIMNDLLFFKKQSAFSFYKVKYKYEIVGKKNKTNIFNWVSFCPINDIGDLKINIFRKRLLNAAYSNEFLPNRANKYYIQRDLNNEMNEFEIDKIICNDFKNILKNKN